jgi:hypothetical protein
MLQWLQDVFSSTKGIAQQANVTPEIVSEFATQLDPLNEVQDGLGRDALRYVLIGEPFDLLARIAAAPKAGEALRIAGYGHSPARSTLYAHTAEIPPPAMLRFAKILANAPAPHRIGHAHQLLQNASWVETLIRDTSGRGANAYTGSVDRPAPALSADYLERILEADACPPSILMASAFLSDVKAGYGTSLALQAVANLTGFADAVARHADAIRPVFSVRSHDQRLHAITLLARVPRTALEPFADEIAGLCVDSSKQVIAAAQTLVKTLGAPIAPFLKKHAERGKPEERSKALRQLWDLAAQVGDDSLRDYVKSRAQAETTASVLDTIAELEARGELAAQAPASFTYNVPVIDFKASMSKEAREVARRMFEQANQVRAAHEARMKGHHWYKDSLRPLSDNEISEILDYAAGTRDARPKIPVSPYHGMTGDIWRAGIEALAQTDGFEPVHLMRLICATGQIERTGESHDLNQPVPTLIDTFYQVRHHPTLLELELILVHLGLDHRAIAKAYFGSGWRGTLARDWPDEAVWPYFARNLEPFSEWLNPSNPINRDYWVDRAKIFRAIATFPTTPPTLVPQLFELALGSGKADRALAQAALDRLPEKEQTIIAALADGKAETRSVAATWLGRLKYAPAVSALEAALKKEKSDVAVGAMMAALELLGVPVDRFLKRETLEDDARKGLAKGVPADIAWFPWDALPAVHWADTGQAVALDVLKWFIVQAMKLKTPEPHSLLRRYCAMFVPREREAFGQFVLDTWLRQDVKPIEREEAEKRARGGAKQWHQWINHQPQHFQNSPYLGKTEDEIFQMMLPQVMLTPAGSAIASKGVLAVAAACCGAEAAPLVARYLKEWYGQRAAQGKALIVMLAWIDHPSATQLMLSVGNRFRTKSFQDEAMRQAALLAERKGWTVAELADRTIPSAGFDEVGEMELSYGERRFTARLAEDFRVDLFNPEGKKISALPEPRKDEDEAKAKEAKKALSSAKKDIKNVVQLQTERLYEALCTQRTWRYDDWDRYLNHHPIMRRLVQRLVWGEVVVGKVVRTFRPLDDQTLTDVDDNALTVDADARVAVAHDSNLAPEDVTRWQQHLSDYEIKPLFHQFGKGSFTLPEDQRSATSIDAFKGHLLESFALRGRATKLGYTRGSPQDGGWFMDYEKRFPTLGIQAIVEFTGSPLPEENRTVALISLTFARIDSENRYARSPIKLSEVPAVLLSECYNDMRLMAAEGTGYDPDWEKKSQY